MKKTKAEKEADKLKRKSMTKKEYKEAHKGQRVHVSWNTGTRTHKTNKDYNRQREKRELQREAQE